jgi:hypothetical protein
LLRVIRRMFISIAWISTCRLVDRCRSSVSPGLGPATVEEEAGRAEKQDANTHSHTDPYTDRGAV